MMRVKSLSRVLGVGPRSASAADRGIVPAAKKGLLVLLETFRAMAIQAVLRKVAPQSIVGSLDRVTSVDDHDSLVRVDELQRTYTRRVGRLEEGSHKFSEVKRLLQFLDAYENDQIRLISVQLDDGSCVLSLVDATANELVFWSDMWIIDSRDQ
jgi:hypothetical protein